MKLTTRQLTLCAVLTAMALALSYLENFFPLSLAIPIPGIKLGLANIVTLFALYALGPGQALLILLARCLLGAVFAGNMNALIFSLLGGVVVRAVQSSPCWGSWWCERYKVLLARAKQAEMGNFGCVGRVLYRLGCWCGCVGRFLYRRCS